MHREVLMPANNLLEMRVPPQDVDVEMAVLGAMLLSAEAVTDALEILRPEHFYKEAHQKIFAAMQNMVDHGQAVDGATLNAELKRTRLLTQVGGEVYLAQLMDKVPTAAHVRHYAEIVYRKFVVRDLIRTSTEIIQRAYREEDENPQMLLDAAADSVYKLGQKQKLTGFFTAKDIGEEVIKNLEEAGIHKNLIQGVATGLTKVDSMTGGLRKSELIILGARPSQGKTALALNIAYNACVRNHMPVAFFSLEMDRRILFLRMLSAATMIPVSDLRSGWYDKKAWPALVRETDSIKNAPLYIDDTSGLTITELRMRARRLASDLKKQGKELGLIVIDYLQLINPGNEHRQENRQQVVAEISRLLKDMARTLDVPVLALAQLNRQTTTGLRKDNKPQLSDLRESGSIEQDADLVALIHRDWYYDKSNPEKENEATLIIAKQRNGAVGEIKLAYFGQFTLFTNLASEQQEEAAPANRYGATMPEEEPVKKAPRPAAKPVAKEEPTFFDGDDGGNEAEFDEIPE